MLIPGASAHRQYAGGGSVWTPRTVPSNGSVWYNNWTGGHDGVELKINPAGDSSRIAGLNCFDSTYALVGWRRSDTTTAKLTLVSRSGTTLTNEQEVDYNTWNTNCGVFLDWLSDTKMIAANGCTRTIDSNGQVSARVITRTGSSISLGTQFDVTSFTGTESMETVQICALTETKALIGYKNSAGGIDVEVLNISGTTITGGNTPITVSSTISGGQFGVTRLDDSHCVLIGRGSSNDLVYVLTISGNSVSIETSGGVGNDTANPKLFFSNDNGTAYQLYRGSTNIGSRDPTLIGVQINKSTWGISSGSESDVTSSGDSRWMTSCFAFADEYVLLPFSSYTVAELRGMMFDFNGNARSGNATERSIKDYASNSTFYAPNIDFFDEDHLLLMTMETGTSQLDLRVLHHGVI